MVKLVRWQDWCSGVTHTVRLQNLHTSLRTTRLAFANEINGTNENDGTEATEPMEATNGSDETKAMKPKRPTKATKPSQPDRSPA